LTTIAVVIPAYQAEPWIEGTLRAVLHQNVPPDEVIVVDDGSTDATADIARTIPGVIVVSQPNQGQAAARNAGARASSSEWVFFLDADDILLPGAIERFMQTIDSFPDVEVVAPSYESEFPDGRVEKPEEGLPRLLTRSDFRHMVWRSHLASYALMRRSVAERFPYEETIRLDPAEDLDLWFRLMIDDRTIVHLRSTCVRRVADLPGSSSGQLLRMRRSRARVFKRLWQDHRLSPLERLILLYQIVRVSVGILVARATGGTH
jgi:glycosyltransferase involved in cell wall biosynthesis